MMVCDKLARKIVLTIRQFLSSSGIDECCDKRMTVIAKVNRRDLRGCPARRPCLPAAACLLASRAGVWGVERSSGRGFRHDAVRPNATGTTALLGFCLW